jgi:hypothetical protein
LLLFIRLKLVPDLLLYYTMFGFLSGGFLRAFSSRLLSLSFCSLAIISWILSYSLGFVVLYHLQCVWYSHSNASSLLIAVDMEARCSIPSIYHLSAVLICSIISLYSRFLFTWSSVVSISRWYGVLLWVSDYQSFNRISLILCDWFILVSIFLCAPLCLMLKFIIITLTFI